MKSSFALVLVAGIGGFALAFWFWVFEDLHVAHTDVIGLFASSFLGAFFAFLFVRLADFFKAYGDRIAKNHNTLVRLDHRLNYLHQTLFEVVHVIDDSQKSYAQFKASQGQDPIPLWTQKLVPMGQIDDLIIDLLNVDLINELLSFDIVIRQLNQSLDQTASSYRETKDAFVLHEAPLASYLLGLDKLNTQLQKIRPFVLEAMADCQKALAAIRAVGADRPLINYLYRMSSRSKYSSDFELKRGIELAKLREGIEKSRTQSRERIAEIVNKT